MKKGKEGLSLKRKWLQEVEGSPVPQTDSAASVPFFCPPPDGAGFC